MYDPTASDEMSRVRGVGRYLQVLRENFSDWKFTNDISQVSHDTVFVNPFFNFLQPPVPTTSARLNIAIIHDLIPLKYPHHFPIGLRGNLNVFLNKQSLKKYDLVITDSFASKKDIINLLKLPDEKITVIYPPVSKIFSEKIIYKKSADNFSLPNQYCIYVGDATWNKNLVTMARAIKEINITCVCVGKIFKTTDNLNHPWQKELHEFLQETKNDKRFMFPGYVSDEELIVLYKNAHCNVLVSRDEGFGFSFVEAATISTPSILSSIDVLQETAGDAALFANFDDYTNIANQIGELYFNEDTRKLYATKSKYRSKFFSRDKFKKDFLTVMQ